ncbi:MAG: hypothetical protein HY303_11980 [Candidatus Wallbacteria bacterium]|nr:hypothetical protein [Candidatus Wallbacteria bacterium]
MARKILSLLLLTAIGVVAGLAGKAYAGGTGPDDFFGDLNQAQQQRSFDDADFFGVMQQELTDFHDVSKHRKPSLQRTRTYPGSYRFYEAPFDVYWDTVSFRSREAQGEGAALVTVMFKDAVFFNPSQRRSGFSLNNFIRTALDHCRQRPVLRNGKGTNADGGFASFDGSPAGKLEGKSDYKRTGAAGNDLDFALPTLPTDERYPWDERVGPGPGGVPGSYGDPNGWSWTDDPPVLVDNIDQTIFRRDKYVVGGYTGLYDFSKDRIDLVKNFLARAAQDSRYERLYSNAFMAPDEGTTYRTVKQILTTKHLPVLTLLPRAKDAVLIYRVVERSDGVGAMMYWRPSDAPNRRIDPSTLNRNIIWAVPTGSGIYQFVDRADLDNRRFRWGNHSTVLIVPNLCRIYQYFSDYLSGGDLNDPGFPPIRNKPFPQDQFPFPGDQRPYPPDYGTQPPVYNDPGMDWSIDFNWRGLTDLWSMPPRNRPPMIPPPDMSLRPPRWDGGPPPYQQDYPPNYGPPNYGPPNYGPSPYYPPQPPPDRFRFRPPVRNPYVNKPIGQGRGAFVKIGFGFDETGFNQFGYDVSGLNHSGFDPWGFDAQGYGSDGFDPWGYDRGGYTRQGYPLTNRARNFIDLVNQYHQNPFAFRMQFDIQENGNIVRIVDGAVMWDQGGARPGVPGQPVVPAPAPVAPPVPGPLKAEVPEWRTAAISGHIKGLAAPYEIQIDRDGRYHILKDNKRTPIPRNINVNADFEMQFQDKTKDYIFIQSTPATK